MEILLMTFGVLIDEHPTKLNVTKTVSGADAFIRRKQPGKYVDKVKLIGGNPCHRKAS